ncbi:MAG: glycan-binding surface protein [Bacteroides sp.]
MKDRKNISRWLVLPVVAMALAGSVACEDQPDKFELTGGVPVIDFVRVPDAESADSIITGAYLSSTICLVGENLTSIKEIYFNDRKTLLNTSYITGKTLMVNVPGTIPEDVTDKMYLVTAGNQTVEYPFKTLVPAPSVLTMNNEYLAGGKKGQIIGDYFTDNAEVPLQLTISGTPIEIESSDQYTISFTMPEGLPEGEVVVTTRYGKTISKFHYKESRNMLFDNWGVTDEPGTGLAATGWSKPQDKGRIKNDEYSIAGSYCQFGDGQTEIDESATSVWPQDQFEFDYWPGSWDTPEKFEGEGAAIRLSTLFNVEEWQDMALKFELYVPSSNPWSSGALQLMFSGDDQVTVGTGNNLWWRDQSADAEGKGYPEAYARALYRPWTMAEGKSFDTADEWMTVVVPLASSFAFYLDGSAAKTFLDVKRFTGFTMMLYSGGVSGTPCKPILRIDNVRVVPYK